MMVKLSGKKGIVYEAACPKTGLKYIGQTQYSLEQAKRNHESQSLQGSDIKFHQAIRSCAKMDWRIRCEAPIEALGAIKLEYIAKDNTIHYGLNTHLSFGTLKGNMRLLKTKNISISAFISVSVHVFCESEKKTYIFERQPLTIY